MSRDNSSQFCEQYKRALEICKLYFPPHIYRDIKKKLEKEYKRIKLKDSIYDF